MVSNSEQFVHRKNTMIEPQQLVACGLSTENADNLSQKINQILTSCDPESAWQTITKNLLQPTHPFSLHLLIFSHIYPHWPEKLDSAPAWFPNQEEIATTNLYSLLSELNFQHVAQFHKWSIQHHEDFISLLLKKLGIIFQKKPQKICDLTQGVESPQWLVDAKMNIVESCFQAPADKIAIYCQKHNKKLQKMTYGDLNQLSNRIANSLVQSGLKAGQAIAIDMPMHSEAVAIYLGIIKMGGVVVSIADSFSTEEIKTRLDIANTQLVFTQDFIQRDHKKIPLYDKVAAADPKKIVVLACEEKIACTLRKNDLSWENFLTSDNQFKPVACDPMNSCNILFSSGTTGTPKAIPWNHTTPIKVACDAYLHHNIQSDDILAWPTNLGWMMGPWLIFAALLNQATIALYDGLPRERKFGEFIQNCGVTMLGVVPTLVAAWRQSQCMENLNWQKIKLFSSSGECSNPEDMLYLMSLARYKPIIEYCGGTEIGGGYISSSVLEKNYPSAFNTPAFGIDFMILDENGKPTDNGEIALLPPALGLSTRLLNADHEKIYFANMPTSPDGKKLRRHGDQVCRLSNGTFSILGRMDDTMNLGAIKISSAEIERALAGIENIIETAAIAVNPTGHGPSQLVIYAATSQNLDREKIKKEMQARINQHLNPLFKIFEVVLVNELPKTASNKIMRRTLRDNFQKR